MARLPTGMGGRFGLKEQASKRARPMDVSAMAVSGNRAQRRFAAKKLAAFHRANAAQPVPRDTRIDPPPRAGAAAGPGHHSKEGT